MASPKKRRRADTAVAIQLSRGRILVVEDQEDVRNLLVTALEIEGHEVDGACNAREGLERLRRGRYDLVLSDYAMPGGTGTWLFDEAGREGLLSNTAAIIVTAHPDARELANFDVIPKPLDLDRFLEQVRKVLRERAAGKRTKDESASASRAHRVELVLYVSPNSPASAQARRSLEDLLDRFDASQVKYSICDLVRDPLGGDNDRVAFTPTLVKRYPAPRMWLVGNLRETDVVADILRGCGVDARA